jgi:hypothetical protein
MLLKQMVKYPFIPLRTITVIIVPKLDHNTIRHIIENFLGNFNRIGENTAAKLVNAGFVTVDGLRAADEETLNGIEGVNVAEIKAALERLDG